MTPYLLLILLLFSGVLVGLYLLRALRRKKFFTLVKAVDEQIDFDKDGVSNNDSPLRELIYFNVNFILSRSELKSFRCFQMGTQKAIIEPEKSRKLIKEALRKLRSSFEN